MLRGRAVQPGAELTAGRLGLRRRAKERGFIVLAAKGAKGVRAVGVEQDDELVFSAVRWLANERYFIGLAVYGEARHLPGDAIEILIELSEPVGSRLHQLHQFVPRGVVGRFAMQGVEQKSRLLFRRVHCAGENEKSESKA
jgi:hypothetical protein